MQQLWLRFQKTHTLGDFFDCLRALAKNHPEVTPPLVHEALAVWEHFEQDQHRYQADLERVLNADNNLLHRTPPKIIAALPHTTPQTAVTFSAPQRVLTPQQDDHALRALNVLHEPYTRAALELEFGNTFKLSDLRLREQEQLLPYLLGTNEAQFAAAREYTQRFESPADRTYLGAQTPGNARARKGIGSSSSPDFSPVHRWCFELVVFARAEAHGLRRIRRQGLPVLRRANAVVDARG